MKKFLMMAVFAVMFAAPSFAEDAIKVEAVPAVTAEATVATPVVETTTTTTTEAAVAVDADAAKAACTTETNEKVKLPENADAAEQAQYDAALAECLKGKGVVEAPVAVESEAAVDAEVKAEETPAAE